MKRKRYYYLLVESYGSTRYSTSGINIDVHVFDKETERDEFRSKIKQEYPRRYVPRVSGMDYVKDKYYHKPTVIYKAEETIRHFKELG